MDRIIPWDEWLTPIQPFYYKGERGNKPYTLELMLRLFILQNLYDLSDEGTVAEGNTWYFGYKAHIGVDRESGLAHTVEATTACVPATTDLSTEDTAASASATDK